MDAVVLHAQTVKGSFQTDGGVSPWSLPKTKNQLKCERRLREHPLCYPKTNQKNLRSRTNWIQNLAVDDALAALDADPQLQPSVEEFVCLLRKCRDKPNCALRLYAQIQKCGLEKHVSIGNYVIPLLAEAGYMREAQELFDGFDCRNEISWTSLISGYIRCGELQRAVSLYQTIQEGGSLFPNGYTFVAVLKACANLNNVECGLSIHSQIVKNGFLDGDLFVGNALIHMYAKLGLLITAQNVLLWLPVRDAVSWNTMIAGYTEHGHGDEALICFDQMKIHGVFPTTTTYACVLRACGLMKDANRGEEIHAEIVKIKLHDKEPFISNALVGMYAKCGLLLKAEEIFSELPERDSVAWTALISGYVDDGRGIEAVKLFHRMEEGTVHQDAVTFLCIVKACGSIGAIRDGQEVHIKIAKVGLLETDIVIGNALVDMYAKCGFLLEMQFVFENLLFQDIVSWNALLSGYSEYGYNDETLLCFAEMQSQGFTPDTTTLLCVLKACSNTQYIGNCRELHIEIIKKGFLEEDFLLGNSIVDAYAKCGLFAEATEVFNRLADRNLVSWNALIWMYIECDDDVEAFKCYEQMQTEGVAPDVITCGFLLRACGNIGSIEKGKVLHVAIIVRGLLDKELIGKALVDMYIRCGSFEDAREVFERLPSRNVIVWTSLIMGHTQLGDCEIVFHLYDRMILDGVMPNFVTFFALLNACCHSGLVDIGERYFRVMVENFDIVPTLEHYTCMIDLLSRTGQLDKAITVTEKMPYHADLVVWHVVLGACQKWGNVEAGTVAFEHAVQLNDEDRVAYVCMSNIFANANMPLL